MLAAQQDKSILNVYNFQKVCLHYLLYCGGGREHRTFFRTSLL